MGLYIKHESQTDKVDNRRVVCRAFKEHWYGDSIYILGDVDGDHRTFYISENHERFYVDNITKYDFVTGLTSDGVPYIDVTFTAIDPYFINNEMSFGVEADICKNVKGRANKFGRLLIGNSDDEREDNRGVCWVPYSDIAVGVTYRLYIRTRYYPRFGSNFCGGKGETYQGKKYDDWKITIGVRIRFFKGNAETSNCETPSEYMLKNFKNYKAISYLAKNES